MLIKKNKRSGRSFSTMAAVAAFLLIISIGVIMSPAELDDTPVISIAEVTLIQSDSQEVKQESATVESAVSASKLVSPPNNENDDFRVFIGIKTSERGVHGQRLPQIHKTWLKDALEEPRIDIMFFTEPYSRNPATVESKEKTDMDDMKSLLVPSPGCTSILCKTGAMFKYFLEHVATSRSRGQVPPAFFCNFDDDNYVIIPNLLRVLKSYHDGGERNLYIGRQSDMNGYRLNEKYNNTLVRFLTGGAGYCISREMIENGRHHLASLHNIGQMPDDIAVGYVIQEKLGGKLVQDNLFHSHLERALRKNLPKEEIAKQVSFGYNNKLSDRDFSAKAFPDIPMQFSAEEDPLHFLSLRLFLSQQESTK